MEDHRITIKEIVGEVRISTGSIHTILTEDHTASVGEIHSEVPGGKAETTPPGNCTRPA